MQNQNERNPSKMTGAQGKIEINPWKVNGVQIKTKEEWVECRVTTREILDICKRKRKVRKTGVKKKTQGVGD